MPSRRYSWGGIRTTGKILVCSMALMLISISAHALTTAPGVDLSIDQISVKDDIGTNFLYYQGRNSGVPAPLLKSGALLDEPDPLMGSVRAIVILIEDPGFALFSTPWIVHEQRFFSKGFYNDPLTGRAGSARDFYLENSHGLLDIQGRLEGIYQVPFSGFDQTAFDALDAADTFVNYAEFDNDGPDGIPRSEGSTDDDGNIDMVIVVYAGLPEQIIGAPALPTAMNRYEPGIATNDGVVMNQVMLVPELGFAINPDGTFDLDGVVGDVGGIVHEMGHMFGLPDLYDTDGSSEGIGEWGLMGSGSWLSEPNENGVNFPGSMPAHLCAWSKFQLGWLNGKIERVTEPGERILDAIASPLDTNLQAFRFWKLGTTGIPEHFLCEYKINKPNPGASKYSISNYIFDATHPLGEQERALLVLHIDDSIGGFEFNNANVIDYHPRVMVVQPDGNFDLQTRPSQGGNRGDEGDVFTHESSPPRDLLSPDKDQFPHSYSYDNRYTGVYLRTVGFGLESATVEFDFINDIPEITIVKPAPGDKTIDNYFKIVWSDEDENDDARIELWYSFDGSIASVTDIRTKATAIVGPDHPISEDGESAKDQYNWDTYKGGPSTTGYVPPGKYYIYAIISDPEVAVWARSRAPLEVIHDERPTLTITKPFQSQVLVDSSYDIFFNAFDDDPANTTIELWATSQAAPEGGFRIMPPTPMSGFNGNFHYLWNTTGVPGQLYYIYGIIDDGAHSVISAISPGSLLIDHKPTFTFIQPAQGIVNQATGTYVIKWTAYDEESTATIDLFYSATSDSPTDATEIVTGLTENDTRYIWDLRIPFDLIEQDRYYIWARIDDGVNPERWIVSSAPVQIMEAVGVETELVDLVGEDQRIDIESPPTEVIGLNLNDNGLPITLDALRLSFVNLSPFIQIEPDVDLKPVQGDSQGGIGVYQDGPGLIAGAFDEEDIPVIFQVDHPDPMSYFLVFQDGLEIPNADDIISASDSISGTTEYLAGSDYFIVVRTSDQLQFGDGFRAEIPEGGLWFSNGQNVSNSIITRELLANIATFIVDLAPETGQILARHDPIAMLGIGMADGPGYSETLDEVKVRVEGNLTQYDLEALATIDGGVALYLDDGDGNFDDDDLNLPVPLATTPKWTGSNPYSVVLVPQTPIDVPDTPDGNKDLYVVIRAGDFASFGHQLSVCIPPNGLRFSVGLSEKSLCSDSLEIRVNAAPTITVTSPKAWGAVADNSFRIEWEAFDPDDDAKISLYYTKNASGAGGTLITNEIREGTAANPRQDFYDWATQDIDPGYYYIYATISDGHNLLVSDVSDGPVQIRHNDTIFVHSIVPPDPGAGGNLAYIEADSEPFETFGINIWDYLADSPNDKLQFQGLTINFADQSLSGAHFDRSDLKPLSTGADSGVVLFIDNGDQEGSFDIRDQVVPLAVNRWLSTAGDTVEMKLETPYLFPTTDDDNQFGDDFYIAIQSSTTIEFGDRFQMTVPAGGIETNAGQKGLVAQTIIIAANVPTLFNNLAAEPVAGEQGQPVYYAGEYLPALGIEMSDNGLDMNFEEIIITADETLEASWEWDLGGPWNPLDEDLYQSRHSFVIPAGGVFASTTTVDGRDSYLNYDSGTFLMRFINSVDGTELSDYSFVLVSPTGAQTLRVPGQATLGPNTRVTLGYSIDNIAGEPGVRGEWTLIVNGGPTNALSLYYWELNFERFPTFGSSDLMPIDEGGISLYEDTNGNGIFDQSIDQYLPVIGTPFIGNAGKNKIAFDLSPVLPVPDDNDGISDVFVVARPSETFSLGNTFYIEVEPYSVVYDGAQGERISGKGGTSLYFVGAMNTPPTFRFTRPSSGNLNATRFFRIEWVDNDPDDNATISLFYDNNNDGFDGVPITGAQNLFEDPDEEFDNDSFLWDTAQVSPGRYYLYAVVTDGENEPVRVYSGGTVTVSLPIVYGYSDLTSPGQRIDATSPATPVIGIRAYDQGLFDSIDSITVEMHDITASATPADLLPFGMGSNSGIALYRDDGTVEGLFDHADSSVVLANSQWIQSGTTYQIALAPLYKLDIPDDNEGENSGDDFYIVIRTSSTITLNDQFRFAIPQNGLLFQTQQPADKSVQTNVITANVPTFLSNLVEQNMYVSPESDPIAAIGIRIGDIDGYAPILNQINVGISSGAVYDVSDTSHGLTLMDIEIGTAVETADWVIDFPFADEPRQFRLMKAAITDVQTIGTSASMLTDIFIDPRNLIPASFTADDATAPLSSQFTITFTSPTDFVVRNFNAFQYVGDIRTDFVLQLGLTGYNPVDVLKIPASSWRSGAFTEGDTFIISYIASLIQVATIGEDVVAPGETLTIRAEDWIGTEAQLNDFISFQTSGDRGFKIDHLLPMRANGSSGIALWRDADGDGLFDETFDIPVALAKAPTYTGSGPWVLNLQPAGGLSLDSLDTTDALSDLFITVQTSDRLMTNAIFSLRIPGRYGGDGMIYSIGGCNERVQTNPLEGRGNVPPDIEILTPSDSNDVANGSYNITWRDFDPDSNALITLYYTETPSNFQDLNLIESDISEDADGEFGLYHWQLADVGDGRYWIVAVISDGQNSPVYRVSPGYLDVIHRVEARLVDLITPDPTTGVRWVEPNYTHFPVIGINVWDLGSGRTFSGVELEFVDESLSGEVFEASDLLSLNTGPTSGLTIYVDMPPKGMLSPEDFALPTAPAAWATDSLKVTLDLASPYQIPDTDSGEDSGIDFFVALRTSQHTEFGDRFRMVIPENGLMFSTGASDQSLVTNIMASSIPTSIGDSVPESGTLLQTAGSFAEALSIAAADNTRDVSMEMYIESLKVEINDLTFLQNGNEIIFDATPLLPIPDGNPVGASSTIAVSPEFEYSALSAFVQISHQRRGDVRFTLTSPEGRVYTLYNGVVTDTGEDVQGVFNVPLPVNGFRQALGPWSLNVFDDRNDFVGTLVSWELRFTRRAGTSALGITSADFYPVPEGGVALFIDSVTDGVFTPGLDQRAKVLGTPFIGDSGTNAVTLRFAPPYPRVPDINDVTPDFFVAVRPSERLGYNDRFSVSIPHGGIRYNRFPDKDLPLASRRSEESGTFIGRLNQPPFIQIIEPAGPRLARGAFRITWEDFDLNDDARVYIYFDTDDRGYDGKIVQGGRALSEDDETDYLIWDISENNPDVVAGGRYWIYAIITDSRVTYRSDYSRGYVQVRATNPEDYLDYVKLHGDGYIFSSGNYDINLGTFLGPDVARDLEVTPDDSGFFVLVSDGHIEFMGDAPDITMGAQPYAPANDAVALEVNYIAAGDGFWDYGGYVGTAGGRIIPFGVTAVNVSGYTARAGHEITDLLLDAEQDGLYVLYEDGVIDTIGAATRFSLRPRLSGARAVAIRLTPSGDGMYMLDSFGGLHEAGGAVDFSSELPYFGFDIARGFIVSPTNSGVAVMTGEGRVHASDGVRVAKDYSVYNSLTDIFRDIEIIGGGQVLILDILEQIYAAFDNAGVQSPSVIADEIMQFISDDYFDDSYNTKADFRKVVEGFLRFYMVEERRIAAEVEDNPFIQIAGPDAFADVLEYWHVYVPGVLNNVVDRLTDTGEDTLMEPVVLDALAIPFDQRVKWYVSNMLSDNALFGMRLNLYNGDSETVNWTYPLVEGIQDKTLLFKGPYLNSNEYTFEIEERARQLNVAGFDFNIGYYPGYELFNENPLLSQWEFKFEGGQWKIVRAGLIQFLLTYDLDVGGGALYKGGFDFIRRSVIFDDEDERISHVRFDGTNLFAPEYPNESGVVDLTLSWPDQATNIYPTTFDEITVQEIRDIPDVLWEENVPVVTPDATVPTDVPHVYAVKFFDKGTTYFGLMKVLGNVGSVSGDEDTEVGDGFVFEWRFSKNFKLE